MASLNFKTFMTMWTLWTKKNFSELFVLFNYVQLNKIESVHLNTQSIVHIWISPPLKNNYSNNYSMQKKNLDQAICKTDIIT